VHTVYSQGTSSNNRFESARFARPTRNGEAPLLAAQPGR
jgi:hypothetical protein